jgi:hypothetical protein
MFGFQPLWQQFCDHDRHVLADQRLICFSKPAIQRENLAIVGIRES